MSGLNLKENDYRVLEMAGHVKYFLSNFEKPEEARARFLELIK